MTKPIPEFDVEKRRRWYGTCLGSLSALTVVITLLIEEPLNGDNEDIWMVLGIWLLLTVFMGIPAYTLWYKPHVSRIRAIAISVVSVCLGILSILGAFYLFDGFSYRFGNPFYILGDLIRISIDTLGIPYLAAVVVGWCFAHPEPDARDSF